MNIYILCTYSKINTLTEAKVTLRDLKSSL